jgi:2-polyprenyl-3-methyl-5-hydroxy-6-metoxy-1,4-benzoquinol methylase
MAVARGTEVAEGWARRIAAELLRFAGEVAYRTGLGPQPSDEPDHRLVEVVEGAERLVPGRALDIGCGMGRNTIYLASRGWDVTGVDMVDQRWRLPAGEPPRRASA